MNIDYLIGLVLLFLAFRAIRAVWASLRATGDPRTQSTGAPARTYRSPRDFSAGSVPASASKVASRLKAAVTKPSPRMAAPVQSEAPFITQRTRRFSFLGLLALAAFIALIIAAHALVTRSNDEPARNPGRAAQADAPAPASSVAAPSLRGFNMLQSYNRSCT